MLTENVEGSLLKYDNLSETITFQDDHFWYSFNDPQHAAFVNKLDWISNHEYGGVGLYSIQAIQKKIIIILLFNRRTIPMVIAAVAFCHCTGQLPSDSNADEAPSVAIQTKWVGNLCRKYS